MHDYIINVSNVIILILMFKKKCIIILNTNIICTKNVLIVFKYLILCI